MASECAKGAGGQPGLEASSSEGDDLTAEYRVLGILGKGRSGHVKLASHRLTGTPVAVKALQRREENRSFIQFEVGVMKTLVHPNIIQLFQVITTETWIYLVMELAEGGNLLNRLKASGPMTEDEARRGFRQIVSAMDYCHEQGFVHRDIKMANILVDWAGNLKVSDFGLGTNRRVGKKLARFCGTYKYWAPEIFMHQQYDGLKMDSWSLGVVLYAMVTKSLPFKGATMEKLREQVLNKSYKVPSHLSEELQDLISELLTVDPDQRPTPEDILCHPWLSHGEGSLPSPSIDSLPHLQSPAIMSAMAFMGYDPYEVRKSIQQRAYNQMMATYLMLEHQARREGSHTTPSRPAGPVPAPCPSPVDPTACPRPVRRGPATCCHPAKRTASGPALNPRYLLSSDWLPGEEMSGREVPRAASLPAIALHPVPCIAPQQEEAESSTCCPQIAAWQPPDGDSWIVSCLQRLCCCLPAPKTHLGIQKKVAPMAAERHRSS